MIIALKKLQPVQSTNEKEVTTMSTPYHPDLTLEQLCYFLDISPKATILINGMQFMLNTVERLNEFLQRSTFANHPHSLLVKMRKEHIDINGYTVKATFVYDYYRDKKAALEKLFQEEMPAWKVNRFKTDDPELIYDNYIERGKYSTAGEVALFI
ncbi:hypothetical protein [Paenibacillus polymyxa]|uniref:hypothetical protein n=1 Tax=Paenibacillus polymyxa TaxID=1406 RepID=UPI002AB4E200|nr:hypothetical protein [Paenibacillus polymyxa]MDY8023403.1 hypothetical protein [Paenibacillus polymyxa]